MESLKKMGDLHFALFEAGSVKFSVYASKGTLRRLTLSRLTWWYELNDGVSFNYITTTTS